jgi:membrane protein DedA with SNARE-associated domain
MFALVDVVATSTIHVIARTGGNRLLLKLLRHVRQDGPPPEEVIARWRHRLGGHDSLVVLVTRMIPWFRLYASISTGLIRIRLRNFLSGAAPASLLWATTPLTLGYIFRHQIGQVTNRFNLVTHWIVIASIVVSVVAGVAWWMRRGGSKADGLRRLRLVLSLFAALGVFARLLGAALEGHRIGSHTFLINSLPSLSTWVTALSLIALGLLWIAAHDLRAIRTHPNVARIGMISAAAWLGLMVLMGTTTSWNGVPYPAL